MSIRTRVNKHRVKTLMGTLKTWDWKNTQSNYYEKVYNTSRGGTIYMQYKKVATKRATEIHSDLVNYLSKFMPGLL